jgi:hypothetical protein
MRVAFTTFAVLRAPYGASEVKGFEERTEPVFQEAENSPGFIARAREVSSSERSNFQRDWGAWGEFCVPRFYRYGMTDATDQRASTLSIWTDLMPVYRFAYSGLHQEALRKRKEWFLEPRWPTYAIWWIEDDHVPQWEDAANRLESLFDNGPTFESFDFKRCFDSQGAVISSTDRLKWRA